MVMVNNLKDLLDDERLELARSPELLNLWVLASAAKRDDLLEDVRAAKTVDIAQARAKGALAALGESLPSAGHTIREVYVATETTALEGDGVKCIPPERYDPITQTCVLG